METIDKRSLRLKKVCGGDRGTLSKPETERSPLDVEGVDVDISREEIVSIVRESRER